MKKRGLSVLLCVLMLLSALSFTVYADTNEITAYITISMYGNIVNDKNGNPVAEAPVVLTGKDSYTLDDAFYAAHEEYYDGGAAAGYASGDSELGLSVTKVWGDTSGKYGYQLNFGATNVLGPTQAVNDGDYIDLCVYENYYPETESYAKFDAYSKTVVNGKAELTLYEQCDYGENWELIFGPCAGATVYVNGEPTEIVTDENGKCTVAFEEYGKYIVSAKKTKELYDKIEETTNIVTAITAPACVVTAAPMAVECKYMLNIAVGSEIDPENSQVSVAGYRDGKLIDMVTDIDWSGNTATVYLNKAATDIKLFVWKSLEGQEPLLETEIINLK